MSKSIYEKYKDIIPFIDEAAVITIQTQVMRLNKKDAKKYRVKDAIGGNLYLFSDNDFPDYVLEIVPTAVAENNSTTLYRQHPIFGNPSALMTARKEMIRALEKAFLPLPDGIATPDKRQKRDNSLAEHGTAQLIDQMKQIFS